MLSLIHICYFDAERKAKIKNLEFTIIPEGVTRALALETGEVDLSLIHIFMRR